jgi:putative transposase
MSKTESMSLALKFLRKSMKRYGQPEIIVTDKMRSYCVALKVIGNAERQETGRGLNSRAENSRLLFRRRERAMQRFRGMRTLQKFVSIDASVFNQFKQERSLSGRHHFKLIRAAALAEWRDLCVA